MASDPDDSSDSDVPLDELRRRHDAAKKRKAADDDDDDGDEEESEEEEEEEESDEEEEGSDEEEEEEDFEDDGKKKEKAKAEAKAEAKKEESDSSDEDLPLGELQKKKKKQQQQQQQKAKPPPKKTTGSSSSKKAAVAPKKAKKANRESAFYETQRGKLVQHLLRRWWYAIEWPSAAAKAKAPEANFETLAGFPGVHVCTSGPRLGELVDHRDHDKCPCFANYFDKPTADVKALVLRAFDEQIKQLQNAEGEQSPLLKSLQQDRTTCSRVNEKKADAEAAKAIKSYNK